MGRATRETWAKRVEAWEASAHSATGFAAGVGVVPARLVPSAGSLALFDENGYSGEHDRLRTVGVPAACRRPTVPLAFAPEERERAKAVLRVSKMEQRVAVRAQALLMMADGVAAADVATLLGVNERTVFCWRRRFVCALLSEKLADAPRSGRPPSLSPTWTRRRSLPKLADHRAT
jgi:hypothetical protein